MDVVLFLLLSLAWTGLGLDCSGDGSGLTAFLFQEENFGFLLLHSSVSNNFLLGMLAGAGLN